MSKPTRIDKLVTTLLPRLSLPPHLRPADLLDDAVVPPAGVAEKIYALRQLVRSGGREEPLTGRIATSSDVASYFHSLLRDEKTESIWAAGCNAKNEVTLVHVVARGGVASCAALPMDILRVVLLNACAGFIVVHNHPSGDPQPSAADLAFTERVRRAGEHIGVAMLDHLIVGASGYFSFVDAGLLRAGR